MAAKKQAEKNNSIEIKPLATAGFVLTIFGDAPLIMNSWTQKGKLQMLKKHMSMPTIRESKDPQAQFLASIYRFENGAYGFPVVAVKEGMATATTDMEGIAKTQIYRNVRVSGRQGFQVGAFCDIRSPMELGEIFSPNAPTIREDIVRLAGMQRTPDLRYRAEFFPWAMRLHIQFVKSFIRDADIINLVAKSGFTVGIGEWRQEKGGNYGLYHVADAREVAMVAKWEKAGPQEPKLIDVKAWTAKIAADQQTIHETQSDFKVQKAAARAQARKGKSNGAQAVK